MIKTLTEQLNNGTLKDGVYYIKDNDEILIGIRYSLTMTRIIDDGCPGVEVLAPMPSYNEFVQKIHILNEQNTKQYNELCEEIKKNNILQKQLDITTKALKGIRDVWVNNPNQFSYIARIANRKAKTALKEMEGVK